MPVNLIISFTVKNEKLQSFKNIMDDVKERLPNMDGCQGVKILNHLENPVEFTLLEKWDSKEIHSLYVAELISSGQWSHIAEHLQKDPVSGYYCEM